MKPLYNITTHPVAAAPVGRAFTNARSSGTSCGRGYECLTAIQPTFHQFAHVSSSKGANPATTPPTGPYRAGFCRACHSHSSSSSAYCPNASPANRHLAIGSISTGEASVLFTTFQTLPGFARVLAVTFRISSFNLDMAATAGSLPPCARFLNASAYSVAFPPKDLTASGTHSGIFTPLSGFGTRTLPQHRTST